GTALARNVPMAFPAGTAPATGGVSAGTMTASGVWTTGAVVLRVSVVPGVSLSVMATETENGAPAACANVWLPVTSQSELPPITPTRVKVATSGGLPSPQLITPVKSSAVAFGFVSVNDPSAMLSRCTPS